MCLLQVERNGTYYGPVFNDTFLSAVFELQDRIQKVQLIEIISVYGLSRLLLRISFHNFVGRSDCMPKSDKNINNNNKLEKQPY